MWKTERGAPVRARRQRGIYAVEFSLVAIVFFLMVFGIVEFARMLYIFNTVQEVTRVAASAAVHANFRDTARMQQIREMSVARHSPGVLPLGAPISDRHVRIEFLASAPDASGRNTIRVIPPGQWPTCPMGNRQVCMANPNAGNCIRYVRAQICEPGITDRCEKARVALLIPLVRFTADVPRASFTLPAESLGYMPNLASCP